ncbi:MAG: bifunctional riboflavin kinase/FAD synthetase [Gemmatimonadota bacterium]
MKIFRGLPPSGARAACALAIGNFDGVHRGHRALLTRVVEVARTRDLVSAVMTFEPHPRELFMPDQAPPRVANLRDKLQGLKACGIDHVYLQHFNRRFASISAEDFIDHMLVVGCRMKWLLVGEDFRFGARRAGNLALLRRHAARGGYEVELLPTVTNDGDRISSSAVRIALGSGDLQRAAHLLGHPYSITGRVLHGAKRGRTLGYPTLNLRIAHKRPAAQGIYAVRVHGIGEQPWPGVASVGVRPTVENSGRWQLEVHLFDFADQIYGHLVRVEFIKKLRDEEKYDTLDQLTTAIRNDADQARALLLNGAI